MAERRTLTYSIVGDDVAATARAVVEQGLTPIGRPEEVEIDLQPIAVDDDWIEALIAGQGKRPGATWNNLMDSLAIERDCVRGITHDYELDPRALVRRLGRIPFSVTSFWRVHEYVYRSPCFGGMHRSLGWASAFQGEGHRRLVSRRWLATGSSRIYRGPSDTTLVEHNQLGVGPDEALAQAQAAHADLMAGFIPDDYTHATELRALHKASQRALVFVIRGRTVSAAEMRDAAAARLLQPFGADKPIDQVIYVFINREEAEAHLPRLWRYGHRVHLIGDDGVERQIDEAYVPAFERPAWVAGDAAAELLG